MAELRHEWTRAGVLALFELPFNDLLARAHATHRAHHDANAVQVSTLLSIKTGGCPEDCAYCPQAARYDTGVQAHKLMSVEAVLERARAAKAAGASRFCMGAAWRAPKDREVAQVAEIVAAVKALGLETCATSRSFGPRHAAPMQKRLAPAALAARARSSTASTLISLCAATPVS